MSIPPGWGQPQLMPLLPEDPPKIGEYWLDGRVTARISGVAFVAHSEDSRPAMVLILSEGATSNPAAIDRFAAAINELHIDTVLARGGRGQDEGRLAKRFVPDPEDAPATSVAADTPWAALAFDGSAAAADEATRILAAVDQAHVPLQGQPAGPNYVPYWVNATRTGFAKVWPLPWPGRHDRAGWVSILMSWLLMVLLALLFLVTAILLFTKSPQSTPPPPLPTTATPSDPQSQTGSPSSPPPSSSSSSPTSSPSSSSSASNSASASPTPSNSASGSASPSPSSASPSAGPGASQSPTASGFPTARESRL